MMSIVPQRIPDRRGVGGALAELHRTAAIFAQIFIVAKLGRRLINSYYVVLWIRRGYYRLCYGGESTISRRNERSEKTKPLDVVAGWRLGWQGERWKWTTGCRKRRNKPIRTPRRALLVR